MFVQRVFEDLPRVPEHLLGVCAEIFGSLKLGTNLDNFESVRKLGPHKGFVED